MDYQYKDYVGLIQKSIVDHWDMDALTDYKGGTLQYKDVARKIEKLHILFETAGIQPGDKIAICGRNSAHWAVAFLATMTYGGVVVPILHEFKADQVHNIVNHSDARLLFVGDVVWPMLSPDEMPNLEGIIYLPDFMLQLSRNEALTDARERLNALYGKKYPKFFRKEHVSYRPAPDGEALAIINYTSGTTSNSKGVLIPYRAVWSNYEFAIEVLGEKVRPGNSIISMLPMAHMYGMSFEFLFEFIYGIHVYYLTRLPSPKVIVQAFSEVKPCVVISVPLIIEKIIKRNVLPKLERTSMKLLLRVPVISDKILSKVREQIMNVFGGEFYEVIIGGAAINTEVEQFLKKIGFNYTVGYGATECAPIITYEDWQRFVPGSCGKAAPRMEVKINSADPQHVVGEILVRGANVMLGYYKNPEATAQAIDQEGWYHTGDLGILDHSGNLFIRGRCKNMLLGSNGQNIYPEEIEDKLNTLPYVMESIVVQKGEKLYALIHPDYEEAEKDGMDEHAIAHQMEQNRRDLNAMINAYEQIVGIKIYKEEFEKTPKRSIKRFLYENVEI
ncbi:long-chain fatty acid--CoA ligase [Alloprevotella sp. OH1205_COT-284]|uniref:AMP-binding protein n=1 Tax=Alloprevotella sp. OH1205_COT-284 TaxID=2491043 RepID=UPI000F5F2A30|nr:AMP-binding protein [Alloprevotella sp. OH1205_COT-284]RRD79308.1 long-chain fatty acid--CoA ligase [Alloprevotella sp. OH1205_COT-284]